MSPASWTAEPIAAILLFLGPGSVQEATQSAIPSTATAALKCFILAPILLADSDVPETALDRRESDSFSYGIK